jgi:nucleoside-diphosphate-sugar epimerase
MKVLVVGGSGLIGRYAVLELLARGHEVTVMARRAPPAGVLPPGVAWREGDLTRVDLAPVLAGIQGVVHAAGTDFRVTPRGDASAFFHRINVDASVRLLRAAVDAGVLRAVFVTSYYHAIRSDLASRHPYIESRRRSEEEALAACRDTLPLCIVQPPFILGHITGRPSFGDALARYVRSSVPLMAPPGGTNFMSGTSLAQALATALERGTGGRRYLVGDENLTWAALISRYATRAGRAGRVRVVPAAVWHLGAGGMGLFGRVTGRGFGVIPSDWARVVTGPLYYDSDDARTELGYDTGNLDTAIDESLAAVRG